MGFVRNSYLGRHKQAQLIKLFVVGATTVTAAQVTNGSRKTIILFSSSSLHDHCLRVGEESEELLAGEIGADESYLGDKRKSRRRCDDTAIMWPAANMPSMPFR